MILNLKVKVNNAHQTHDHQPSLFHFNLVSSVSVFLPFFCAVSHFQQAHVLDVLRVMIIENFFDLSVLLGFDDVNYCLPFAYLQPVDKLQNLPNQNPNGLLDISHRRDFIKFGFTLFTMKLVLRQKHALVSISESNLKHAH